MGVKVTEMPLIDVIPYERNPRRNDGAVSAVAASIKEFGFKNPIIVDKDKVIIAGHTRYKAAMSLGLDYVPVIIADDLSPDKVKALRLADNKTGELAEWDLEMLSIELDGIADIDMSDFGFDLDFPGLEAEAKAEVGAIDLDEAGSGKKDGNNICHCPKCGFEWLK